MSGFAEPLFLRGIPLYEMLSSDFSLQLDIWILEYGSLKLNQKSLLSNFLRILI
jgi:hypothetical protein